MDESKRGSYFGPLVAVAYVVDEGRREELWQALACNGAFTDSKELSKKQRRALLPLLRECGVWRVGYAKSSEIDALGTNVANNLAFKRAIAKLPISPTKVLVDGNRLIPNLGIEQIAIPGGDTKELAIAAASILCKEFSDDLVERLGANLPHNFTSHHGYSCDADLERYGAAHRQFRRRFSSVKRVLKKETNLMVASDVRPAQIPVQQDDRVTVEQVIQDNFVQVAQSSTSFYEMRDRVFKFEILEVHPDLIDLGLGTQCRSKESQSLINEWATLMKEGDWDIDCQELCHDYPELVAGEEGTFFPLSHHRAQAAKASQTTLKYKVWLPNGASLPFARILAATSNPQKNQPWQSADQPKRVNTLLDNWDLMTDALKDEFIKALEGLLEDQQMTRLKNSRKLSDYVLATVLGMPHRTAAYHRKIWENQKKVKDSGIKVGDRVSVIAPLKNFAVGEAGTVADVNFKQAEILVSWDGQPGQAPFPIPLAHLQQSNEPKPAILHFSGLVDLLVAVNGDGWNKDVLVEHKETGVDFEGYHARYSSLDCGYWFVTPNDQGLAEMVEAVKQARSQFQAVKDQATPNAVLPEPKVVIEGGPTVSEFEEQTGTTPQQYIQAQTVVPSLEPLPFTVGEVVMVKFNKTFGAIAGLSSLGVVRKVEQLRCIVYFGLHKVEHAIEAPSIKKVPENQQQEVKEMHDKINELCKYELDPVDLAILEQLSRQTEYSDRAYRVLASIEREYEGTELKRAIEEFRN